MNLPLRPDWSLDRLTLAIQLVLDRTVVRSRTQPDRVFPSRWATASLYADRVLGITLGALDPEPDGLTMLDGLDKRVRAAVDDAGDARG